MGCGKSLAKEAPTFRDVYEVREKLGEGAFGVVHEVVHRNTGESLAVKMIDRAFAEAQEMERETAMLKELAHPNIVRCVDVFMDQCFCYIIMQKYGGGDLVDGLQSHLKDRGKIPDYKLVSIVRQMMSSIAFIHEKGVIHRDVKGDNFLMDRPDITDPECLIALSDFGTAVHLAKGQKLSEHTGTSIFWAPEVINKHYDFVADVWAVGIVFFGLIDGTFPFRDARQILHKVLRLPKAARNCLDLLQGMLEKDPSKRFTAERCCAHPWLKSKGEKPEKEEKKAEPASKPSNSEQLPPVGDDAGGMAKEELNTAVQQRRMQLMKEQEKLQKQKEDGKGKKRNSVTEVPAFVPTNFAVDGPRAGEKTQYEWWEPNDCKEKNIPGTSESEDARPIPTSGGGDETQIRDLLVKHGINVDAFGSGLAKTLAEFAQECQNGEATMAEDCKKLIRVVDVVLVKLGDTDGMKKLLVEKQHQLADGRTRQTKRLPGTKRRPHESAKATAVRVLESMGLSQTDVTFVGAAEQFEDKDTSPSYPGIETVYRKYIMKVHVSSKDANKLSAVGLPKAKDFVTNLDKEKSFWSWVPEKQCKKMGIRMGGTGEASRFAGLAPVAVKCTAESVQEMLQKHNIDVSMYGIGSAKTFEDIAKEVQLGEADLMEEKGKLLRVVNVVGLRIRESKGRILIEASKIDKTGQKVDLCRLPGTKQRPHENAYHTARRVIGGLSLGASDDDVTFNPAGSILLEEEKDSPSYPGLKTLYRKHIVDASIGVDSSKGNGNKKGPTNDKLSKVKPA